jgi:hypothetical protein
MKSRWLLYLPVIALPLQLVPPVFLWEIYASAYVEPRLLPDAWERPLTLLVLGVAAVVSLGLGSLGTYGLLTQARLGTAIALIVLCCAPVLLAGAFYLQTLIVFLAIL